MAVVVQNNALELRLEAIAQRRLAARGILGASPSAPAPDSNASPYLDKAAPDLAAALRGPVGSTLLDGGLASRILDVVATSSIRSSHLGLPHSAAWLVITTHDRAPCVVIVSISPARASWSPAMQRYEEIVQLELRSPPIEPGRFTVIEARASDGALFRPFRLDVTPGAAGSAGWVLESIWNDELDPAIYRAIERAPAGRPGDMIPDRAWRPLPTLSLQHSIPGTGGIPTDRKIACARLVLQRNARASDVAAFVGKLHVAISRPTIRALAADSVAAAIALAPDHAEALSRCL